MPKLKAQVLDGDLTVSDQPDGDSAQAPPYLSDALYELISCGGPMEKLRPLIDEGTRLGFDVVNEIDSQGDTPLFFAIENDSLAAVRFLLSAGADMEFRSDGGQSPLQCAARLNQVEMVKALLDHGAFVDAVDVLGRSALHTVAETQHHVIAELLIDRGANLELRDHAGSTPLHTAAQSSRGCVGTLIRRGADLDATNIVGSTALHLAVIKNRDASVSALLAAGASLDVCNQNKETPLHIASRWENRQSIVQLLLTHSVRINPSTHLAWLDAVNQSSLNATQLAVDRDNTDTALLLLDAGASLDVRTSEGFSLLHQVALFGNVDLGISLLKRGIPLDIEIPGQPGQDPLAHARKFGGAVWADEMSAFAAAQKAQHAIDTLLADGVPAPGP